MASDQNARPAVFRAVWPVLEGQGTATSDAELILQAIGDLPDVAHRHHARITGDPKAHITEGRHIQGSGGHKYVVIAEAPAEELPRRGYHHHPKGSAR